MTTMALPISACASLPNVQNLNTALEAPVSPTVMNAHGALTQKRSNSLLARRWAKSPVDMKTLAALEEAATGVPLIAGNSVTLLFDGPQTMAAMIAAINTAKSHINLETYIFDQDELGLQFADLLITKQKEGVRVTVIYDSVGTIGTPSPFFSRMRETGIRLIEFNPVNPLTSSKKWSLNSRDHRKILIVDGTTAFTGGVNISADYSSGSLFRSRKKNKANVGWRDTHIKIEGPAVAALQWSFLETWASQVNEEIPDDNFFPPLKEVGDKVVRILVTRQNSNFEIYKSYVLAIQGAAKSVHITSAYFVPDKQIIEALSQAARRGVDVKIVLPGVSDSGLVTHAGHSFYTELLDSGVKIFQLQIAVLHAKTAVIDNVWSTVGSTNIDMRSFLHNNEVNVVILGDAFGSEMEKAFNEDLRGSIEITKKKWKQRPLLDRIKELAARTLQYWL